jgi:hypothetical protein
MLLTIGTTTGKIVLTTIVTKTINSVLNTKKQTKEDENYLTSYKIKLLIKLHEKISNLTRNNIIDNYNLIKTISNKLVIILDDEKFNEKLENYNYILSEVNNNEYPIDIDLINNEMKSSIKQMIKA